MGAVAETERVAPQAPEPDRDEVDFGWLTGWLRRRRLIGPARREEGPEEGGQQLALFEAPGGPGAREPSPPSAIEAAVDPAELDAAPIERSLKARCLLVLAMVGYIALFSYWTTRHHDGLGTQAFDFGIYDQGLWLLSRFERPFITIMGRHLFGDHTSFILLPLVPVFWLIPSAKVLLVSQSIALGLGAVPTFLLAREKLRYETLAALLAVAYLLHPVVGWTNLEQFHPDAFEVPLVLFAIYFMVRQRWVPYFVCVGAVLLVKEDVALLTFALGLYVAVKHDRRIGLITCGVSLLYAAAAFWWILPGLNGVGTLNTWRIPFGGPWGLLRRAVTHPGEVLSYVLAGERMWYVWQLLVPLGFLPFAAPAVILIAILPLAGNVVSTFPYQYNIHYHYSTLVLPVLVAATILGIARQGTSVAARQAFTGLVVVASVIAAYLWGPTPLGRHEASISDPDTATVRSVRAAVELLPGDAVVSAYYGWIPQIDHRDEVYMFPNPWKASYWGTFRQEGKRLPQADRVQYLFVPSRLDPEPRAVFDAIRGDFDLVYERDGVALFKRKT